MGTHALEPLVRFCAGQARRFDPEAWRESEALERRTLAVAAKYLSMTSWYGHAEKLERVAETLRPGISAPERFHREAIVADFDLGYFSAALRARLAAVARER